jgi:hypothetical protein
MTKPTFSQYLRANLDDVGKKKACGPFVTISFEYGCDGSEIGQSLVNRINARIDPGRPAPRWTSMTNHFSFSIPTMPDRPGPDPKGTDRGEFLQDVCGFRRRNIPDCQFSGLQIDRKRPSKADV